MSDGAGERFMSRRDAILWDLDRDPRFRAGVASLLVLDREPDQDRFLEKMERISRLQPRLRQRVVESPVPFTPPRWLVDGGFDLTRHLRRVPVEAPGDLRAVLDVAATETATPFDPDRPQWRYTLCTGLSGGRAALLQVAHHAIADGIGGVELAAEFFDADRTGATPGPLPPAPEAEALDRISLTRDALEHVGRRSLAVVGGLPAAAGSVLARIGRDPVGSGRSGLAYVGSALRLMRPVNETASPVMRGRSEDRRYDVLDVDFDALHRAARTAGATVNDAFLTAISTGLGRYHEAHDAPVDGLRVTMPISTRRAVDPSASNRNDAARFELPVGADDIAGRMARVHAVSSAMRREPALAAPGVVAGIIGLLPAQVMVPVMGSFMFHMDLLVSNVPGFPDSPYLCGARVEQWYLLGPTEGSALAVTLLSHAGRCCVGITTDGAAVEDADRLVACLREGFEAVLALAG